MRLLVLLLCVLLAACGGGGGSSAPAALPKSEAPPLKAATTLDHYAPFFAQGQRLHGIVVDMAGNHYTDWYAQPNNIRWTATQAEQNDVRECMGKRWSFLIGFEDDAAHAFYKLENVKTTLDGQVLDCPQDGVPYQPYDLPADGRQVVEQWGYVHGADGSRALEFYWKAEFVYGTVATNPCWIGDGPKTRPVISQSEVWWDSGGGWTRGGPVVPGQLPWQGGAPNKVDVFYGWEIKNAQDAAMLWLGGPTADGRQVCLQNVVPW